MVRTLADFEGEDWTNAPMDWFLYFIPIVMIREVRSLAAHVGRREALLTYKQYLLHVKSPSLREGYSSRTAGPREWSTKRVHRFSEVTHHSMSYQKAIGNPSNYGSFFKPV
jgi:hypothetical protein